MQESFCNLPDKTPGDGKQTLMKKLGAWSFVALGGIGLVVGWRPLAATFTLAWQDNQYTHILLILPVSAALIYLEWPALKSVSAPNLRAGPFLLAVSVLAAGILKWSLVALPSDVRVSIGMLALVLWWIGAFVLCFGTRVSRSLMFPLCFLLWLVPFPEAMLNAVVTFLQRQSAVAADVLFTAAGVPVARDGVLLTIPGLTVQVAQECSSIRSSLMLLVTTTVLAQLWLRSPWRKALVIAVAVPLSVAKNALRIFTIAMLGTRVDPGFLTGKLHHQGGIVFFLISLVALFVLLWILRRTELHTLPVTG
jgi:exosortase